MYFLIDYENVNYAGLEGTEFLEKDDIINFFFSGRCDKIVKYRMIDIEKSGCKFGRKKTILVGVLVLGTAFLSAIFANSKTPTVIMYVIFALAGIGWATINVNSFPMVVELAKGENVGRYTGFYYTASMAAQTITPVFSGVIMDLVGNMSPLFPYATFFVLASFLTMLFVKYGDNKPTLSQSVMESLNND